MSVGSVRGVVNFVRFGLHSASGSVCADHLLARSMRPLLMLMAIGLLCLIVHVIFSTGDCINHIIQTTIATTQAGSTWQWLWVTLNCCASVISTPLLVQLQPRRPDWRWECMQSQWSYLIGSSNGAALLQAIRTWRMNMEALERPLLPSTPRVLISWVLHLPVLCIAMAPSAGYVSC